MGLLFRRYRAAQLVVLTVGFGLYSVLLKAWRIRAQWEFPPGVTPALQAVSDVAFAAGWILLWVGSYALARRSWVRTSIVVGASLLTTVMMLLVFFNHEYQMKTGSPLTLTRIGQALFQSDEIGVIIAAEFTVGTTARLLLGIMIVVVLPLLTPFVASFVLRDLDPDAPTGPPRIRSRILVAGGVAACMVASAWSPATASAQFSRAPLTNIILTPVLQSQALTTDTDLDLSMPDPDTTHLVPTERTRPLNVVLITLESQRATETLPETEEPVTPVLDELRTTSLTADRAYAILPHTSKSLVASQCGMEPPFDHENSEGETDGLVAKCLPRLLAEQGYATAFFQSATESFERRRQVTTNLGYETFRPLESMDATGFSRANYFGFEDNLMLEPSRAWVESLPADQPFLLSYLTVSAHHDYTLPGIPQVSYIDAEFQNAYLNGLHYQDQFVGNVIEQFKELGLYDSTVFVILGDHGEGFWEHGAFGHDDILYDEGVRIPLMIHGPGVAPGAYRSPIMQSTVTPSVLDVLGYDVENSAITEQSMLAGPDGTPTMMTCLDPGQCVASVADNKKYIHYFGDRQDLVFDLENDPGEMTNIARATDPAWIDERRTELIDWWLRSQGRYEEMRSS